MAFHRRALPAAAYALTWLTGAASLVYQMTWQRYLARLLGSDGLATATVLGVFLGGLSLGYFLWGRLSRRRGRLFVVYGALELAIGAWVMAFPWLFALLERATAGWSFAPSLRLVLQGTACAVVLIGPPTVCMGATVPMLTRGLTESLTAATRVHARVYGINTAGAVVGALAAGFFLLFRLGLPGTLRWTAWAHLAAGLFFVVCASRLDRPAELPLRLPGRAGPAAGPSGRLYAIAFCSGCAFMTLETLVVRLVNLSLGSSTYSFALTVAAFILAVAVGALAVARGGGPGRGALLLNQAAVCAGLVVLFPTLDVWPYAAHVLRIAFSGTPSAMVGYYTAAFVLLALVLLLPLACMGATLPLVFDAAKRDLADVGATAGTVFAWNAAGHLLGGIVGGYAIYRLLDLGQVYLGVVLLAALGACLAAWHLPRSYAMAAGACVAAALLLVVLYPHDPLRFAVGTFRLRAPLEFSFAGPAEFYREFYRSRTVLAYRDAPDGTYAVVENPRPLDALIERFPALTRSLLTTASLDAVDDARPRSIVVNGKSDSSTYFDRETLRLVAHLPALLGPRRERVLVVGLGTGVTAAEFALHSDVRKIDVVEISRSVVDFLPLFERFTRGVQHDPRLRIHVGDAFRVLRRSRERWDVIASEPSNPWMTGVSQLFSREFYRLAREHLAEDGVFVQWIQRYATNDDIAALAVNTLRAEFPHVRWFRTRSADDLLLASARPWAEETRENAAARLARRPAVANALAGIGLADIDDLLALEDPDALAAAARRADLGLETLDHPRLHFMSGRAFFAGATPDGDRAALGY